MKIYIPNISRDPKTLSGKGLFCWRLGKFLLSMGVNVTDDPREEVDISLNLIYLKHEKSKIRVLRLDNVWHDTGKRYREKNKPLASSLCRSDAVVYQSNFGRVMCDKYLGVFKGPKRVIFNGADPRFYEKCASTKVLEENVFVAFSKWRPHKRLRDIIESFLLANIDNSVLYVAGDLKRSGLRREEEEKYFRLRNIKYLGMVSHDVLAPLLKVACASIHLCWFDACPNSVVEAIAARVPVICNNTGGTAELVRPSGGYVCDVDKPYDLEPVDLYHPPLIDRRMIAEAMRRSVVERPKIKNDHVSIHKIAEQYLSFMKELMK